MAQPGFATKLRNFLGSEELESTIESFLDMHAQTVRQRSIVREGRIFEASRDCKLDFSVVNNGEYDLEVYSLWQKYLSVIEEKMEAFRASEGIGMVEFKTAVEGLPKENSLVIRLMIASWEFQQFVDLCIDHCTYRSEQKLAAADDDDSAERKLDYEEDKKADFKVFFKII